MKIKWAYLTSEQKDQIKSFYEDELKKRQMFEHNLNTRHFSINNDGNVVFSKES